MPTPLHSTKSRRLAVMFLFTGVLAACGGGGDSTSAPAPGNGPAPSPPPAASLRWISSAAQIDLAGGADSGVDGPLLAIDPARPQSPAALNPGLIDSTSVRIMGGKLDATLSTLDKPGPRFVIYDAALTPATATSYSLYKLALDVAGTAAPVAERISTETALCSSTTGTRFNVLGQSLSGDEALVTYQAPDSGGSCATGGVPKLVKLSMGPSAAPISLPTAADQRITPIGVIHGSSGQVAAVLAWRNGGYVRTDASLANPVALASADVAGTIDANAAPTAAGIVTRYGIFIKSADGLRRYDKSTGKVSPVLLTGQVGVGAQVNDFYDELALYITTASASGVLDIYRISDTLLPTVIKLNTEGPLYPWGFRVLKSYVLYALNGRDDFTAWRKADGQRSNVLAGKNVVQSSTLYDRVFHTSTDALGKTTLASSALDGSDERSLGVAQLASGSLAAQTLPFARSVRGNGAFAHAVVVVPASGKTVLSGGAVRWVSFDTTAQDIDAGTLPGTLDLGATAQAPGIVAEAGLLSIPKPDASASYLFVSQRASGSLARVNNGVQ